MKIRFIQQHILRGETRAQDVVFEEGQIVDFGKDPVANSYATAYIDRGYAEEYDEVAAKAAERAARVAEDDAAAKTKADADAKAKAAEDAKAKANQQGGGQKN